MLIQKCKYTVYFVLFVICVPKNHITYVLNYFPKQGDDSTTLTELKSYTQLENVKIKKETPKPGTPNHSRESRGMLSSVRKGLS